MPSVCKIIVPTHVGVNRSHDQPLANNVLIVPTHVGVNRALDKASAIEIHCPHSCGGEPGGFGGSSNQVLIVPTHVGVNRLEGKYFSRDYSLSPLMWG